MSPTLRSLWLALFALLLLPLQAGAQTIVPMLDLGLIPDGQERFFQLRGQLDIETATQAQGQAAVQRVGFSFPENSGFCVSAATPGDTTVLFLVGRERVDSPILFDVNTGVEGLSNAAGRRSFAASVAPIDPTTFVLAAVVGQSSVAPGDTITVFVRVYPDTTPQNQLEAICGAPLTTR